MQNKKNPTRRDFVSKAAIGTAVLTGAAVAAGAQAGDAETEKKVITSQKAALPVGPYSQGIRARGFIFVAGEKGLDPKTGKIVSGGIGPETRQALENIKAIVEEAGGSLDDAVSSTVHLTDISEFEQMNRVYAQYFKHQPPGRTTVGVASLPAGARVEITVTVLARS
ncbi:MAG: Rid family detoxifying hydrolase [Acidobacteriota bacterium]